MDNTLVIVRDGAVKLRAPGRVETDGSIRVFAMGEWVPVVNSAACAALNLDPKTVARSAAPIEALARLGDNGYGLVVFTAQEWDVIENRKSAEAAAALESAVPGIAEAIRLSDAAENEQYRFHHDFTAMMEDENNDGARPPEPENMSYQKSLADHLAKYPRAALYLKAKRQSESAHWADNTGRGAAGKRAMEILAAGGTVEDAQTALAARRAFVD